MPLSLENSNSAYASTVTNTVGIVITDATLLLVRIVVRSTSGAGISSVTHAGSAMTLLGSINLLSDESRIVAFYYKVNPAAGTNNVVLTLTQADKSFVHCQGIIGVDTSDPIRALSSANGSGTTPTVNVASASGELVFDCMSNFTGVAVTVGAGQTQDFNGANSSFRYAGSRENGASSVTMSWTQSSEEWEIAATAVKPAASGSEYSKTCAVGFGLSPGPAEKGDYPEALACGLGLDASDSEKADFPKAISAGLGLSPVASEVADFVRTAAVSMGLVSGDVEQSDLPRGSSVVITLQGSATGTTGMVKATSVIFNLGAAAGEIADFVRSLNPGIGIHAAVSEIASFVATIGSGISVSAIVSGKADFAEGIAVGLGLHPGVIATVGIAGVHDVSAAVNLFLRALAYGSASLVGLLNFVAEDVQFSIVARDRSFDFIAKAKEFHFDFRAKA